MCKMADRRRRRRNSQSGEESGEEATETVKPAAKPPRESECESEGNTTETREDLSEYESANEENKGEDKDEDSDETETETETEEDDEDETEEEGTEYGEDIIIEGEGWVEEERQSGDGQEQPELSKEDLDDDEDKKNPAYVPRKGAFYEHDMRIDEEETKDERPKKKLWKDEDKWLHDRYSEGQQAPKSRDELIAMYGYDIRAHDKPPDRAPRTNLRRDGPPREKRNQLGDFMLSSGRGRGRSYNRSSYDDDDDQQQRPKYDNENEELSHENNRQRSYEQVQRNSCSKENRANNRFNDPRPSPNNYDNRQRNHDNKRSQANPRQRQDEDRENQRNYNQEISNRGRYENDARGGNIGRIRGNNRGRYESGNKGRYESDNRRNFDGDNKGRYESDNRRYENENQDRYETDNRGHYESDNKGHYEGSSNRHGGGRFETDTRGRSPRMRGRGGPRLQRGGQKSYSELRSSRSNYEDRSSQSNQSQAPRLFTNTNYRSESSTGDSPEYTQLSAPEKTRKAPSTEIIEMTEEESSAKSDTIQITVVNSSALNDPLKSYSRERRRGGRTRVQDSPGYSVNEGLPQNTPGNSGKEDVRVPPAIPTFAKQPAQQAQSVDQSNQVRQQGSPPVSVNPPPPQERRPFPPPPIVKQDSTGQSRSKRYSSQRQRNAPDPAYPEQTGSPIDTNAGGPGAYFNAGFPPAPIFRPDRPQGPQVPPQEGPYRQPPILQPPIPYPVPVSRAGLPNTTRLYAGGPPVSLSAGQPMIPPQYLPGGLIYGAPPSFQMPAPVVPVQNFPSPPPPVPVPAPVPIQSPPHGPPPNEVYRGGTTYYAPQLQPNPNRSPVRRPKLAIPIVKPEFRDFHELQVDGLSPQYYYQYDQSPPASLDASHKTSAQSPIYPHSEGEGPTKPEPTLNQSYTEEDYETVPVENSDPIVAGSGDNNGYTVTKSEDNKGEFVIVAPSKTEGLQINEDIQYESYDEGVTKSEIKTEIQQPETERTDPALALDVVVVVNDNLAPEHVEQDNFTPASIVEPATT